MLSEIFLIAIISRIVYLICSRDTDEESEIEDATVVVERQRAPGVSQIDRQNLNQRNESQNNHHHHMHQAVLEPPRSQP